ncbi:MAG: hypothetical protein ACI8Y7_000517 [Candidatus Woesearchaeota archaeon]|jgi:hypothetical protein
MQTEKIPKTKAELRSFILSTITTVSDRIVPTISIDEQEELDNLYGDSLYVEDYDASNTVRL